LIENKAFSGCFSLLTIAIPSAVQTIFHNSFADCRALSTVTFESDSKLSLIYSCAFSNCSSLSAIWIPAALRPILAGYPRVLRFVE
jgi:hypothetical protein